MLTKFLLLFSFYLIYFRDNLLAITYIVVNYSSVNIKKINQIFWSKTLGK